MVHADQTPLYDIAGVERDDAEGASEKAARR
jgi:hypothetical protein